MTHLAAAVIPKPLVPVIVTDPPDHYLLKFTDGKEMGGGAEWGKGMQETMQNQVLVRAQPLV